MAYTGETADDMAAVIHVQRGTFYAKLAGIRNWTIRDLNALAAHGVSLPPFGAQYRTDLKKVGKK